LRLHVANFPCFIECDDVIAEGFVTTIVAIIAANRRRNASRTRTTQ
jgi:hypothetical protein